MHTGGISEPERMVQKLSSQIRMIGKFLKMRLTYRGGAMTHGVKALAASMLLFLAGCVATGHGFDSTALDDFKPGQTTMAQAVYLLNAPPERIYPQSDGTTLAMWRFHVTLLTDGAYGTQQALLLFGPDGRFIRLVDGTNLLISSATKQKLSGGEPPPAAPASELQPAAAQVPPAPGVQPAAAQIPAAASGAAAAGVSPSLGSGVMGPPPGMDTLQTFSIPVPPAPPAAQ